MKLKVRFTLFTLIFLFLTALPSITAQDSEHLTITTYYPSPVGSYNEMTVASRQAIGDVNEDGQYNTGDMAVDGSGNPINGTLTVKDRLGIGTREPKEKLEVAGRVYQSGLGSSTFFGFEAGKNDDLTNNYNTAVGYQALYANTAGDYNTAVGCWALRANTTGYQNTAIGEEALQANTTGYLNTAIGPGALYYNTTGINNMAIGGIALRDNTTGSRNIAIGVNALQFNTTGNQNTAIGINVLVANTTGTDNIAIGPGALSSNTTGNNNMAVGNSALQANTTGINNIAIGPRALLANTTGYYNIAIGFGTLDISSTGANNTAIGVDVLAANDTGSRNTAIGFSALTNNTTGNENTAIGYSARALNNNDTNSIVIGANAVGIGANSVVLGNDSIATTALKGNVGIGTTNPAGYKCYINGTGYLNAAAWVYGSDRRLKENVEYIRAGLSVINQLKPVQFDYIKGDKKQVGFIAQEVQKVLPNIVSEGPDGMLGTKNESIIPYLVKAIQEQQQQIEELKVQIQSLRKQS